MRRARNLAAEGCPWAKVPPGRTAPEVEPPLPPPGGPPLEEVLARRRSVREYAARPVTLEELSRLLYDATGITDRRDPTWWFRSVPSSGALYPIEVYVAAAELPELIPSLYHYHPAEHSLRRLRPVDVRPLLARAADEPALENARAVLVLTGIMWRTAWKYEERGYRHLYWDAGTMLANLLELAPGEARVLTGFVDDDVNDLLGIDGVREAALALLVLG